jgi:hypothetical protein
MVASLVASCFFEKGPSQNMIKTYEEKDRRMRKRNVVYHETIWSSGAIMEIPIICIE